MEDLYPDDGILFTLTFRFSLNDCEYRIADVLCYIFNLLLMLSDRSSEGVGCEVPYLDNIFLTGILFGLALRGSTCSS